MQCSPFPTHPYVFNCIRRVRLLKLSKVWPAIESTSCSIFGKRKLSFGHALLKSVKSTHIIHFPFAIFTSTTLEIHSGYLAFLMNHTRSNFSTSIFMASYFSWLKHPFFFCFTGLAHFLIANLWQAIFGLIFLFLLILMITNLIKID